MLPGPVLIANRGEIAVRVAQTLRRLGVPSVAIFTEADSSSRHVDACDLAVAVSSYLDGEGVLAAAERANATALHPGYGFLSENASFARAVTEAGLAWIGPPPSAIELMGDKDAAKHAAASAGVPVVPQAAADEFPVIVKAVAGGGGKGMRVVRSAEELESATAAARREAAGAFGDDRVITERFIERPRHIEVQVLADSHGAVIHVGERECSLQRRHQKVIEEAPSPVVDPALRDRMGEAAVAMARAAGYVGAGTVEFIVPEVAPGSAPEEFFFLEMNTRLQVEHPVTELVYGVDLVEEQLRVAAGAPLALRQEDLDPVGHAIEARLYAEDPANGFLPSTGEIVHYREPSGEGVRVDSGVRAGTSVGTEYDPLLAKVIAWGEDRATAIRRLDRALGEMELLGVATNAAFSRALLGREDVASGSMDTGLLERILASDEIEMEPPEDLAPAAALAGAGTARPDGPWRRSFEEGGAFVVRDGLVIAGDREWAAELRTLPEPGRVRITLDGVSRAYAVDVSPDLIRIGRDGHQLEARTLAPVRSGAGALEGSLKAPMPGTVLLVHVENGDEVAEGETLLVLESMKMELPIISPRSGVVEGLELTVGDKVALKQPLVAVSER